MSEWQPIETAPKDGEEVLLWLGAPWCRVEKALWFNPWKAWVTEAPGDGADTERYGIGSLVPTHWMPLPQPPETNQ